MPDDDVDDDTTRHTRTHTHARNARFSENAIIFCLRRYTTTSHSELIGNNDGIVCGTERLRNTKKRAQALRAFVSATRERYRERARESIDKKLSKTPVNCAQLLLLLSEIRKAHFKKNKKIR